MPTLFNKEDYDRIVDRINQLTPESRALWGKMNVGQMVAHCHASMETAMGLTVIEPIFIGRIIGSFFKAGALSDKPFGKNSPTDKSYKFPPSVNFREEKPRLLSSVQLFSEGGPAKATRDPHPFFGRFSQEQWGVFQWKHLDHHLRQFGV